MREFDRTLFAEAMHVLGETFNEPISDIRIEGYFDALQDFSIEQVNVAVRLALRDCRFFPKPVELREMIAGAPGANADAAWGELIREVRRVGYTGTPTFSDDRAMLALRETWGSWQRLCETLPGEGPELIGWAKQFKAAFLSLETRDLTHRLTPATIDPVVGKFIASERKRLAAVSRPRLINGSQGA